MSLSSGFPPIPNSITDTVILEQSVIDADAPIPFGKFQTIVGYYSENIKEYYADYVRKWNEVKKTSSTLQSEEILDRYKNFIREIAINYTTIEEKTFFDNIDFDDNHQLEMAIPFFTEKIKSIASYYKGKREDVKFQTTKNKSIGIPLDFRNKIKDFTVNFIENLPDAAIKYDLNSIRENISVEIQEFYDSYPIYFDQTPDTAVYDYKDLDYGLDIFLRADESLINEVFVGASEELRILKEAATLFDLKRKETIGNVSTDFYYLSTGNTATQFLSGKLFDNTNDIGNFFNKNYPTTASTSKSILQSNKDKGFFKPQKTGILLLDGVRKSFSINTDNLKPNTLYYFPDPLRTNSEDFLEFTVSDENLTKNQTSGIAKLEPKINKNDTTFHGYISERSLDGESKYLQNLFNKGYVKDLKKDVYGNTYGIFTNDNNFRFGVETESQNTIKQLVLNGHTFYDNLYNEGFAFDYQTYDNTTTFCTDRSGLSAYTGGFTDLSGRYTLFGRYFTPYEQIENPCIKDIEYVYYDGGFIGNVIESMSSDLSAFPGSGSYYYDTLIEGGIHTATPLQRALLEPDYLTDELGNLILTELGEPIFENYSDEYAGNLLEDFIPDEINTFEIDCGTLSDDFIIDYTFKSPNYLFDNTVNCSSVLSISSFDTQSYMERKDLNGILFVKNVSNGEIAEISTGIPYLSSILSQAALSSVENKTVRFEVVNDVLCVETDEYFVSFKIGFDGEVFENPKKSPIIKEINNNPFNRISERFYVGNKIHYSIFDTVYPLSSHDLDLEMFNYHINLRNFTEKLMGTETITLSSDSVIYDKMDFPVVTYDDIEKVFNVSTLLKDQNYMFDVLDINYQIKPYDLLHVKLHNNEAESFSNISTSTITMLSSANITNPSPYLLVI